MASSSKAPPGGKPRKASASKASAGKGAASKGAASKAGAGKGGSRKGGSRGGSRGGALLRRAGRWLLLRLGALGLGACLGLAAVVGILYRQALADVDGLLDQPLWTTAGRVLSGPMEIWPGMVLDAEDLANDLQRAGYARVTRVRQPGDFQLSASGIDIMVPAASGPGWKVDKGEVLISFADGRVALAGGRRRVRLAPTELATIRGADNEERRPVPLARIPSPLVEAVLAMEDARFREHEGLDPLGIARALLVNAWAGGTVQGGSTLTQQLVKNLFLSQERTYERKAREALLAVAMEQRRSKDQILELYLNDIYLGQAGGAAICGVDQAARAYFGKPAERLDLGESATLAGMISAPNRYSPLKHPEAALERRDLALHRMVETGALSAEQAEAELARPLQVHALSGGRRAPWAVDASIDQVEATLGEGTVAAQGLTVHTTINPALQRLAEQAVAAGAAQLDQDHPGSAGAEIALIAVRVKDGAIVALVGGRDYGESQYDRALSARRQIGSTVKPLTWLFAFDADPELSPASVVDDAPIERTVDGKRWAPTNYDHAFLGPVSLREALVDSRNVPAVLVSEKVGLPRLQQQWQAAGLSTATDWPSAALGAFGATPEELAGAYTVFPRGGSVVTPFLVRGATGPAGASLVPAPKTGAKTLTNAASAFLAADILRQVITRGTGRGAARYGVSGPVGGKTGTTDDGRDAWFVGTTDELAVAVWVGFDRDRALGLTGAQAALPTWARFVAGSGTMDGRVAVPEGLVQVEVCAETGAPPCLLQRCDEKVSDWFRDGHEPRCGQPEVQGERPGLFERLRLQLRGEDAAPPAEPDPSEEGEGTEDGAGGRRRGPWRRKR